MKNLIEQRYQVPFKDILPFKAEKVNFKFIRFFYLDIRFFRNRIYYFPEYFCCKTIFIREFLQYLNFEHKPYKINSLVFLL